ncbi:MAG: Arylsulfatase [Verrucomicrobiota bacterium]|jgi:arylsulfatase A
MLKKILPLLLSAWFAPSVLSALPDAGKRLNIVILYADDLGYGDLGCYNPGSKIPTPHLNRLAAEGVRFTDGHSSSGICTPSRYALLTGRHHWRDFHGIDNGFDPSFFRTGQLTLQEMLRKQGYATACIGKWHLGWDWNSIRIPGTPPKSKQYDHFDWTKPFRGGPCDWGFDSYFGDNVINFPPYCWIENDRILQAPDITFKRTPQVTKEGNFETREGPGRSDWDFYRVLPTLTAKAVEYVHSRKAKPEPFFLYVPLPSPHAPIVPNDTFDGASKAGAYGDFVVETDDSCGRILQALRDAGLESNTIVVFSADNGAENYAYARDETFHHWSSHPLRGLKRDIYEGGHRVPFIIKWPGVIKPAQVSDALVSQVDLMATIASLTGVELPPNCAEDSHDLLPVLKGQATSARQTLVHNTMRDHYAIRHEHWLLVDAPSGYRSKVDPAWEARHGYPAGTDDVVQLFDLKTDLSQRNNLAAKEPAKVRELQERLKKIRDQGYSAPRLMKTR